MICSLQARHSQPACCLPPLLPSLRPGTRFLRIAKSPAAPPAAFAYRVTGAGLEAVAGVEPPAHMLRAGSVAHQAIANEVPYEQSNPDFAFS